MNPNGRLLAQLGPPHRRIALFFLAAAVAMIPWIVFLGITLPPQYTAKNWNVIWVGFDVALVAVLAFTGWAAWFRRQIMASTTLVAATLLVCDAWFDIVSSIGHPDAWVTLLTGFGAEIPLALFFIWLYRQIAMRTMVAFHEATHDGLRPKRFRDEQAIYARNDTMSEADVERLDVRERNHQQNPHASPAP